MIYRAAIIATVLACNLSSWLAPGTIAEFPYSAAHIKLFFESLHKHLRQREPEGRPVNVQGSGGKCVWCRPAVPLGLYSPLVHASGS